MKQRLPLLSLLFLLLSGAAGFAVEIDRMEPPFWYTGMQNRELQVLFHGKDIAKAGFTLQEYEGVSVRETALLDNPNYLIAYLDIAPSARPGTLTFEFQEGRKKTRRQMELRPRNTKTGAQGFSQADVLYLIMPDRFANGNPANDRLENFSVNRQNGGARHGGDLQGIREHLDYIDRLGVTAIWLNPVQFNRSGNSHGYAISDFYLVDPRLGTNQEYCELVDQAHQKGIKVVMDMIFNHAGSSHWWIEDLPDSSWFNQAAVARRLGTPAQPGPRPQGQPGGQGNWGRGRMNGLQTTTHYKWALMDPHAPESEKDILVDGWFSGGMPDLNQRNPHLAKYLIQNSIWWIEYARIDGIRMDTYPYADYDFMVRWCREVEAEYPDFNIVGEGWYPRNSAAGWWQGGSAMNPRDSHLKTVMDFDLTFTAKKEILKESNTSEGSEAGLFKLYECIAQDFLIPDPDHVLTFLDNHDIARFMEPGDPVWKLKQGLAFLLTTRGIPQIYYGTEIAMGGPDALRADFPGGWADDARSAFTPEGRTPYENECWDFACKLLNWRRSSGPVTHGKLVHYTPDNATKCYVYARTDGKNTVLVMLNGSDREQSVDMARFSEVTAGYQCGKDAVTGEVVDITRPVKMQPRGVYVLDLEKTTPPFAAFGEGMIDRIQPQGWLKEILRRQRDGLTGHPEAMAYPYNSVLWAGELKRDSENRGADWWRFEQTAYYLDGLTRLGYLLDDEKLLKLWQDNIEYVLAHPLPAKPGVVLPEDQGQGRRNFSGEVSADPRLQERIRARQEREARRRRIAAMDRPEGRLGPETESMAWPFAVFFRAMKAYYEATGDPRIPTALEKNYLSYPVEELGMDRFVVNVEGILWTYSLTRNPALLDLAVKAWAQNASELTQASALDDTPFTMHGVTMNELLKVPLLLYAYTGEQSYLDAALHAAAKMEGPNMLVDGINSSSEALSGNDPLSSHETCDVSDYTWTMGYYLMVTGDGGWADRIERGIFNAGLGSITKDFKSMQYFSCPNQVIATGNSNHNRFKHGLTWMAYRPIHETECCIGNLHRYMPNYVARMWLKDREGHPVAALYGPSSVEYDLEGGITVRIQEETLYPFEEQVRFRFTFLKNGAETETPVPMNFTYRIPAWCTSGEKGFHTVSRNWRSGDTFTVELPMAIRQEPNPHGGLSLSRGPIVYTYSVPALVEEDKAVYDNLAGKVSANPDFKSWKMTPAGPWNYALAADRLSEVKLISTGASGFPFDPGQEPLKLRVPVVKVKGWTLEEGRYTPAIPDTVTPENGKVSYIDLVPYGSTTLRLTIFPTYQQ